MNFNGGLLLLFRFKIEKKILKRKFEAHGPLMKQQNQLYQASGKKHNTSRQYNQEIQSM